MFLGTKRLAFLGLLLALTVSLTVVSSVIEVSTFFFLAAASFLVGAAFIETGKKAGCAFYLASVLLSFLLVPNKLYCLTFAVISAYIVIIELVRDHMRKEQMKKLATLVQSKNETGSLVKWLWVIKFVLFNIIYLPVLFFFPKIIFPKEISTPVFLGLVAAGQVVFLIYDLAYDSFITKYWGRIRKHLPF